MVKERRPSVFSPGEVCADGMVPGGFLRTYPCLIAASQPAVKTSTGANELTTDGLLKSIGAFILMFTPRARINLLASTCNDLGAPPFLLVTARVSSNTLPSTTVCEVYLHRQHSITI